MPAPKGNQNARSKLEVEAVQIAISCDKELTQLLRQAFYSNQYPHRWPETNRELTDWVRKHIRPQLEYFARSSTDWILFESEEDE